MAFVLLLIGIELLIFITNFSPGKFLVGWDNVMPEFDLPLNLLRSVFGVWQEYRGLGLLDGMSHTANLFHTIYISFLSLFLPQSSLRYIFIYGTHLVGGIAFFYLIKYLLDKNHPLHNEAHLAKSFKDRVIHRFEQSISEKNKKINILAFFGSLFYLCNIGVIQMYFAPLEVFATHFAALPLITLLILKTLDTPSRKNYLLLFVASLLTTPQGFVPTVFIVFGILFGLILLMNLVQTKQWKTVMLVGVTFICANAFWMLPYAYSATHTATIIKNTRINQFSSEEIFYRNKAHGDLFSVLSLQGFMIDTIELNSANQNDYFMKAWRNHVHNPLYIISFLFFFILLVWGILTAIRHKKQQYFPFLGALVIAFIFLANNTFGLEQFNTLIRTFFPILGEAFRFPFTKFITLYAFCFSIFVTLGLVQLLQIKPRFEKKLIILISFLFLIISFPLFRGNFTSPLLRQTIPSEYLEVFSYLQQQPTERRVALFPVFTFWNWQYRSWGQRGSGFLWHGIPQPIMERAFDPWSTYNEEFYNEMAYAVNTQDQDHFASVIKKYDISYILLDQYLNNSLSTQPVNYESLKRFLSRSPLISEQKTFGRITIYRTTIKDNWVYQLPTNNTVTAYPTFSYEKQDTIGGNTLNYVTSSGNPDIITLFPSLFTEKLQSDVEFTIKNEKESLTFSPRKTFPLITSGMKLQIPNLFANEFLIPINISVKTDGIYLSPMYPSIVINEKPYSVTDTPIIFKPKFITKPTSIEFADIKQTINLPSNSQQSYLLNSFPNTLILHNGKQQETVTIDTTNIQKQPYTFSVTDSKISNVQVVVPKIASPLMSENIIQEQKYELHENDSSPDFRSSNAKSYITKGADGVTMSSRGTNNQLTFYKDNLFHQASYLLLVNASYDSGLPVNFYLDNPFEKRAEVETLLSKDTTENVIFIPKTQAAYQGYGFHLTVKSLGTETAESTIHDISYYPIPAATIKAIRFVSDKASLPTTQTQQKEPLAYAHILPSLYSINSSISNSYLTLSQSYDPLWHAYTVADDTFLSRLIPFWVGTKLKKHVVVNNWANGWEITDPAKHVMIVFLPQYLTFLGFGITFLFPIIFYITRRNK